MCWCWNNEGVVPFSFLKAAKNVDRELKPTSKPMASILGLLPANNSLQASLIRHSLTYPVKPFPKLSFRSCESWCGGIVSSLARSASFKSGFLKRPFSNITFSNRLCITDASPSPNFLLPYFAASDDQSGRFFFSIQDENNNEIEHKRKCNWAGNVNSWRASQHSSQIQCKNNGDGTPDN